MNIIVAVDLSPASAKVIEAAHGVAELTGVSIYVLHVIESEPDYIAFAASPELQRSKIATDFPIEHGALQTLVEKLQDDGLDAEGILLRGPAVDTTLSEADRLGAGLIVVGTHGHAAVYDVLVGSCSAGIIRKSKLPVLVVPVRNT
ncbi:MAG: universal stress protein [Lysobacterales bacterium]